MQFNLLGEMNSPIHREILRKKCKDPVVLAPIVVYFLLSMVAFPFSMIILLGVLVMYFVFLVLFSAYLALYTTPGEYHSPPPGFMPIEFYVLHLSSLVFLHALLFGSVVCAVGGVFFVLFGMFIFVLFYRQ